MDAEETRDPVGVSFQLFTTSFCGACRQTRAVLDEAVRLLSGAAVSEHDVAFEPGLAESLDIRSTPTVIMRDADGSEIHRAVGVPTIRQVLVAAAKALDARATTPS